MKQFYGTGQSVAVPLDFGLDVREGALAIEQMQPTRFQVGQPKAVDRQCSWSQTT